MTHAKRTAKRRHAKGHAPRYRLRAGPGYVQITGHAGAHGAPHRVERWEMTPLGLGDIRGAKYLGPIRIDGVICCRFACNLGIYAAPRDACRIGR